MKLPHKFNTLSNEESFLHLNRLGWSSFFQEQIKDESIEHPPARVVGVRKNAYLVTCGREEKQATLAGKFFHEPAICLPAVGDWVLVRDSVIISVLLRKNVLSRKASGSRNSKNGEGYLDDQVIAANLDTVFIVCGLDRDFNLRRIERYLAMVLNCGIDPAIILTKADLHENPDRFTREVEAVAFGIPVYIVSANENDSLIQLKTFLPQGRTAALIGSSGAGKSTLINRLFGEEVQATGMVSANLGKGKHTTTSRDLIVLPSGGMVIDNPGIREIALTIDDARIESAFPDIEALTVLCKFKDCSHTHEPGCRVLEAVTAGEIAHERVKNFQKLKSEISYHLQRENKGAARVEKERWKEVSQKMKSMRKRKK